MKTKLCHYLHFLFAFLICGGCTAVSSSRNSLENDSGTETVSDTVSSTDTDGDNDTETITETVDSNLDAGVEQDIEVVITADNSYGFGYGTTSGLSNFYGGVENITAGQIFSCAEGPEQYVISASEAQNTTYLYIISYSDYSVTQGVIGQFRRIGGVAGYGELIYTGDVDWEVCATGLGYDPGSGGPSLTVINEQIIECNSGTTMDPNTTSMGWVNSVGTVYGALAAGEDNTTPYTGSSPTPGNEFPLVCTTMMDADARWMWFNWDPATVVLPYESPFMSPGGINPDHSFLIFRLSADSIPISPD